MKRNLKMVVCIFVMVSILAVAGVVNAFSASMKLETSSKLKVGDVVEVTLKLSNIDAGNGIDAIAATLEYDKNVFDVVTQDSFTGMNNWSLGIYSTDTQMLTVLRSSKVNVASDVLKVSLKVKSVTNIESTVVKFKDITASGGAVSDGGTGEIEIPEAKVTVSKAVVNQTTNTQNTIKNQDTTNTQNTATGKLPHAGEVITIGIGFAILLVLVVAIVSYVRYRNLKIK